jgi:hypothetical protein
MHAALVLTAPIRCILCLPTYLWRSEAFADSNVCTPGYQCTELLQRSAVCPRSPMLERDASCAPSKLLVLQNTMLVTHVVMNYGLWLDSTDKECGQHEHDTCPFVPQVCEFLTGEHPFRVIWQTTTPRVHESNDYGSIAPGHHLHIPLACDLDPSVVINRGKLLHTLEENAEERKKLYHDEAHFSPEPSHVFNGYLMHMIANQDLENGDNGDTVKHDIDADNIPVDNAQEQSNTEQISELDHQAVGANDRLRLALG